MSAFIASSPHNLAAQCSSCVFKLCDQLAWVQSLVTLLHHVTYSKLFRSACLSFFIHQMQMNNSSISKDYYEDQISMHSTLIRRYIHVMLEIVSGT